MFRRIPRCVLPFVVVLVMTFLLLVSFSSLSLAGGDPPDPLAAPLPGAGAGGPEFPVETSAVGTGGIEGAGAMVVTGVWPAPSSHTSPLTSALIITTSGTLSQTSVTTRSVVVHGGFHGHMDGTINFGSIVYHPSDGFFPGELVETTVTTAVVDMGGQPLATPYIWRFRVAASPAPADFRVSRPFGTGHDDTVAVGLGDLDGDGDLDLVAGNYGGQNIIYLNDGDGTFDTISHTVGPGDDQTYSLALGDLDEDGDPDLVVGNCDGQNAVYLNDGDGTFDTVSHNVGPDDVNTYAGLALGDVDGDGDLDLALGNYDGQNVVYLNDGDGTFDTISRNVGPGDDHTGVLTMGDLDGDGDLDLVVGNDGLQNVIYMNDGDGTFDTDSHTVGSVPEYTWSLSLGDLDGDGDLDLAVGNFIDQDRVYFNDGDGTFDTVSRDIGPSGAWTGGLSLGDMDGDGDLDLILGFAPGQALVYLNAGDGAFDESRPVGREDAWILSLVPGDVNGDGLLDLAAGHYDDDQNMIYLNRLSFHLPVLYKD